MKINNNYYFILCVIILNSYASHYMGGNFFESLYSLLCIIYLYDVLLYKMQLMRWKIQFYKIIGQFYLKQKHVMKNLMLD